ncbi:zinc finger CCCH domain-containing protein 32 [Elaeis guineensis]|uniref:Zinc finger CCCH domain-containing protein 32 n=1 Tax=Elaeis guineensis var. tenera TaxID=51953 RepID=A0A6I9S070_ELAGV|nr:zinc finger CCCH domain-containing protein 32 [Elaeis guineensis]
MESGGGREGIRPLTDEEEALKRNTDCVYFLASPLTCKKGNECEYRHSEGARINPRDCWYWLNGNCLNPKCLFRHPPLDGLLGTPGPSSGPAQPPSQTVAATQIPKWHAPYAGNKQNVPCYYFQKGHCLKGEKCPFMHGPQTSGNPVSQQVAKVSITPTEPPEDSWAIKDCTAQQNIPSQQNVPAQQYVPKVGVHKPKVSVNKPVQVPPASVKPVTKAESGPSNVPTTKKSLPPHSTDDELYGMQQNQFPVSSGYAVSRPRDQQIQPSGDRPQNGREADEFLGESSPGFDVLVDDDIEESDYFHNEDNFGRASVQGGRNQNPMDEYDYHHDDYESRNTFERDRYNGVSEYDRYGEVHDAYGWEPCRASSERISERSLFEGSVSRREANYDDRDGSDLRHRLLKQRRLDGSRSAVSPDGYSEPYRSDDHYIEERDRGHHSHRSQRPIPRESSISTRLRGRITLPGRSSPDIATDLRSENDRHRGRPRGRLSPPRPINYQGRHHERVRRRSYEEFAADARSTGVKPTRRDDVNFLDFAGPKSLAELKGAKVMENSQEPSTKSTSATASLDLNKMKSTKVATENFLSFEGPKPLSVILKRKREAASGNGGISSGGDDNNRRDVEVAKDGSVSAALSDVQSIPPVEAKKDGSDTFTRLEEHQDRRAEEEAEEEEEEGLCRREEEESIHDSRSSAKEDVLEEDHMEVDAMEDQELENYDQRYGESDYEADEGGNLKTDDDENVYQEDEDELDDEDDFAKKVGVMFS